MLTYLDTITDTNWRRPSQRFFTPLSGLIAILLLNGLAGSFLLELGRNAARQQTRWLRRNCLALLGLLYYLLSTYAQVFAVVGIRDTLANRVTHSIISALYFTSMTWTTVGYGDLVPSGSLSRLYASISALNGYTVLAFLIAAGFPAAMAWHAKAGDQTSFRAFLQHMEKLTAARGQGDT